jgi:hypothetical protein
MFKKIIYEELNSWQQENFNFQKVAAHLADYGFNRAYASVMTGTEPISLHVISTATPS